MISALLLAAEAFRAACLSRAGPLTPFHLSPAPNLPPLTVPPQAHFQRAQLKGEMELDQRVVVGTSVRLLQAAVDVIASQGWLHPAIADMEMSQMVVQVRACRGRQGQQGLVKPR